MANAKSEKTYLIAFKWDLPSGYQAEIEQAGGTVIRAIPEIGIVSATSWTPFFYHSSLINSHHTAMLSIGSSFGWRLIKNIGGEQLFGKHTTQPFIVPYR